MAGKGSGSPTGHSLFVANLPYSVDWRYLKDLFRDQGVDVRRAEILEIRKTGQSQGNGVVEVGSRDDVERAIEALNESEVEGRHIIVREDKGRGKGKAGRDDWDFVDQDYGDRSEVDGGGRGPPAWHGPPPEPPPPRPSGRREPERREHLERSGWPGERRGQTVPREVHQEPEDARVYIERLPPGFPWQRVKDLCRNAGLRVKHADMVDRSQGVAVVELIDAADVPVAIDELSGTEVEGRRISVRPEVESRYRLPPPAPEHGPRYLPPPPPAFGGGGAYGSRDDGRREAAWDRSDGRGAYGSRDDGRREATWDRGDVRGSRDDGGRGGGVLDRSDRREDAYGGGRGGSSRAEEWADRRRGGRDREPSEEPPRGKRSHPAEQGEGVCRLFAENLPSSMDWRQLKDLFKANFDVVYADVIDADEGEAYGIVEFRSRADALEACMEFNGVLLDGKPVRLRQDRGEFGDLRATKRQRAAAPEPRGAGSPETRRIFDAFSNGGRQRGGGGAGAAERPQTGYRVFVGNLDFRVTWQELKDHMRQAGNVRFCDVLKDQGGRPKGCGIVEYGTEGECENAMLTLSESELMGRPIRLKWAEERGVGGRR